MATYSVIKFGTGARGKGAIIERKGLFSTTRWVKVLDKSDGALDKWVNTVNGDWHWVDCWDGDLFYRAQEAMNG